MQEVCVSNMEIKSSACQYTLLKLKLSMILEKSLQSHGTSTFLKCSFLILVTEELKATYI